MFILLFESLVLFAPILFLFRYQKFNSAVSASFISICIIYLPSLICQRSTILMFKSTQFYNCLWLNAQVMRFEVSHNLRNQIGKGKLISSEVATGGVLQGKVFLEILWNSQENTCYSCRILLLLGSTWKKNYIKTWYIPLKRLESQDLENQQDQFREVGQNILQTRI